MIAVAMLVLVGAAFAISGPGHSTQGPSARRSPPRASDPLAEAGAQWPVFGGTMDNTRFSALDQVNASNARRLGVAWSKDLGPYQTLDESFPLMIGRTLYVTTSTDEVMAFDAVTGKQLWRYAPQVDFSLSRGVGGYGVTVNRGVAVSGSRIFVLTFDDHLQSLSRATGERLWSAQVVSPHTGAYETMAPTVWHGLVFVGSSGSEDGVRGSVAAYDANTGKQVWRFWTVPAAGHGWVKRGQGGGTVYMPPTVDARTGLLYVGTSSPSPTIVGTRRPGADLYSSSILALDARAGRLVWYHQEVAHDLWDYDAESPVVVFDARVRGHTVRAVAEAGKSGYLFVLDARTGKDLFPPRPFVKEHHTPPTRKGVLECPGSLGGAQYGPDAYSPQSHDLYVVALNMCMTLKVTGTVGGYKEFGGTAVPQGVRQTGSISAFDTDTGRFRWHYEVPWPMIGGATATAGGLVLAGDTHGLLYAFDAHTGKVLWKANLGLAFGSAPIVYQVHGTEYIAAAIGGSPLSANFKWGNVGARVVVLKLGGEPIRPYQPPGA